MNVSSRCYRAGSVLLASGLLAACGGGLQRSDVAPPCYEALPEYGQCLVDDPGSNDLTPECKFVKDICAKQTDPASKKLCIEALANCQLNVFGGKPPIHPQHNKCGKLYEEKKQTLCPGKGDGGR